MSQEKVLLGHSEVEVEQGTYHYPIYSYRCPICKCFTSNIGSMDQLVEGVWHRVCVPCEEQQWFEETGCFAREDDYLYEGEEE